MPCVLPTAGYLRLDGDVHHRLANVLRLRIGEQLILRDPRGSSRLAEAVEITGRYTAFRIHHSVPSPPPPPAHVTVVQALGKGDRFEQVLQHGTELGVSAFVPIITLRTIRRHSRDETATKLVRWRRILEAAAEQSERDRVPEITAPCTLEEAVGITNASLRYALEPSAVYPLQWSPFGDPTPSIAVFVGPEGGFTTDELDLLTDAGVQPRSLGPYVLRTETAALAAVSILLWSAPQG